MVGCRPYAPAAFTPRKYSWYSFLLEAESTPGPQCDRKDFMSMKNPVTPVGIEPATFRFVAQHLNHCATAVPTQGKNGKEICKLPILAISALCIRNRKLKVRGSPWARSKSSAVCIVQRQWWGDWRIIANLKGVKVPLFSDRRNWVRCSFFFYQKASISFWEKTFGFTELFSSNSFIF